MFLSKFTQIGEVEIYFSEILKSIDQFEGLNLTMISNSMFFEIEYKTFVEGEYAGYENVP